MKKLMKKIIRNIYNQVKCNGQYQKMNLFLFVLNLAQIKLVNLKNNTFSKLIIFFGIIIIKVKN